MTTFTAACIQNHAQNNIDANLPIVRKLIREAVDLKADFISLPECVSLMEPDAEALEAKVPEEKDHPFLPMYEEEARSSGVWILGGSLAVRISDKKVGNKIANRLYLFNPTGYQFIISLQIISLREDMPMHVLMMILKNIEI